MRILATTKPVAGLPKPPYDDFFECVSFEWGGQTAVDRHHLAQPTKLVHQLAAISSSLIEACLALTMLDVTVLYERTGTGGEFIYLSVGLSQATIGRIDHNAVAGGSPLPLETLTLVPSAVNGTFYDEGGHELGRTSFV